MKYSVDQQERYSIFKLEDANLNSSLAPELKSQFIMLSNHGVRNLIFDISSVEYIDSSGLSAILTANRLYNAEGTFIVTGVKSPSVEKLIKISRLDTILTIIPTVSESKDYVNMKALEDEINAGGNE